MVFYLKILRPLGRGFLFKCRRIPAVFFFDTGKEAAEYNFYTKIQFIYMLFFLNTYAIKMKYRIAYYFLLAGFFVCGSTNAQLPDCTLGMGGKDTEVLTKVFQLNDEQIKTMDLWIGELHSRNKEIEDRIKELFDNHPQGTQEELVTLAKKYKDLKDQLVAISTKYDQQLLGLFNDRQYQRYIELCAEALRKPLSPIGTEGTSTDPE